MNQRQYVSAIAINLVCSFGFFIATSFAAEVTNTKLEKIKTLPATAASSTASKLPLSKKLDSAAVSATDPAKTKALGSAAYSPLANPVRVLLVPDKETTIASTMAARIVTFNGTLGQSFRAGDTLVAFDCEEALARVEMSKAELSGAIEQHEAKVKMQGLEQASDVEVALAASASNKAKAQLNLNQAQVSQCRIYAPWAGRVAKANVKNHMTVTPGQPLMELVNSGPLKLKMNLPSIMLARTKVGYKFNITIDETAQSYQASVSAINSRVDPVSQTVEIEARMLKSYKELLAGMSGVASF